MMSEKFDWELQADKLDPRVKQIFEGVVGEYAGMIIFSLGVCESPIEQLMALALNSQKERFNSLTDEGEIIIIPQAEIVIKSGPGNNKGNSKSNKESSKSGNKEFFRVDFLIRAKVGGKRRQVIVECDGHEFHEKTKEQAAKDKQRARMLVLEGYIVLNYTGSEIWGSPFKCAREALGIMFKNFGGLDDGDCKDETKNGGW